LFNPTYLQRSRHGIFYFRWTLARPSEGDQSTSIRLSLRTREPRQALQLAMPLSYLARNFTIKGQRHGMDHRATYKQFCGGTPDEEARANGINRLNYGSLEPEQQEEFKRIMHAQQVSNWELLNSLSPDGQASFCQGLNHTVTTIVVAFVQAHPLLFETVEPALPKPIDMNSERFRYSAALLEGLYVGKLTVLEPIVQADIDRIRAESHDVQTFERRLTRFPDLYEAMRWELNRLEVQLGHMDDPAGCYGPNIENWLQATGCS
jgi:hypothetical protein